MISIRNLSHQIGETPILQDIDLELPAGGITALIGPNGAGKSTLLNLIARLTPVQQGQITVDGLDVSHTATRDLALKLAVVAQNPGVPSRLRVRDLVKFGRWPHHRGRPAPEDMAVIERVLEDFGLSDLSHRFLDELSGGQQQRAFVAMGFAQSTDWLLLDEPLNNLDMYHARALMARVHALTRKGAMISTEDAELAVPPARSIVAVVHEINYVGAWADHVVALKNGRVAVTGPTAEVLTSPILSDLFGMEMRVQDIDGRPMILHHM